jgi:hypothetical protein
MIFYNKLYVIINEKYLSNIFYVSVNSNEYLYVFFNLSSMGTNFSFVYKNYL